MNQLILGDCLEVMRKMDSESIDLIYLDPPFFSNRNYEVIWGDKGEVRSFEDRWSGGIDHYISWLKERVSEMHRLLKPTGSIYLHCDWHANAYIRVYILDKIFGENNFQDEIIWHYDIGNAPKNNFKKKHDCIFRYSKDKKQIIFKLPLLQPLNLDRYNKVEEKTGRRYFTRGDSGKICYADEGVPCDDVWTFVREKEFRALNSMANERIGYPTQKPEKLLERIIKASSNEGDVVLDPFVGGGTTVVVADKLKRNWIGIDQSVQAIKVSEFRLNKQQGLYSAPFVVQLHKYDYDTLRYKDAFQFEAWIVDRFGGISNLKQRGDFGIDGKTRNGTPIQVKRSDNIGRNVIDNFHSSIMRYDKALYEKNKAAGDPVGFIIAFSFGKGAIQEVARLKNEENITIKLVTVEEIVPIAKKPKLNVSIKDLGADEKGHREIEFTAEAESETEIEFFAFDFDYNEETKIFSAEEILNKEGKATNKFKAGTHTIAIKVIDSEGLEAMEVIKIKVNGEVERE